MTEISLQDARALPFHKRPITLLFLMAIALPLSFSTWSALLNNFVVEMAAFQGDDIGLLHFVREIPGFLAVCVIFVLIFMREQTLALWSLALLGVATAVTAWFPSMSGLLIVTLLSSIGFHYYETVNQSLQLQWLPKDKAPEMLGLIVGAGSAATFGAYGLVYLGSDFFDVSYNLQYLLAGSATLVIVLYCALVVPQFKSPTPQNRKLVLRKRYWLYYALQFMAGARRQIFVVFAGFMMVEHFGFEVEEYVLLLMGNMAINMVVAPFFGRAVRRYGERNTLAFEYVGLILVFLAYGGIYWFGWGIGVAIALYILDHLFFSLAFALKTYIQKIADPDDIAPTAAVAFTINHIAAVGLPVFLGLLWLASPGAVFALAAAMALVSLILALMIPRHPEAGNETIFSMRFAAPAE